jgi:amino acid permease
VSRGAGIQVLIAGAVGLALFAVGAVYLTVQCQALPGFLGPTHGDASPRTGLGVVFVALGLVAVIIAFVEARRRRDVPS